MEITRLPKNASVNERTAKRRELRREIAKNQLVAKRLREIDARLAELDRQLDEAVAEHQQRTSRSRKLEGDRGTTNCEHRGSRG